LGAQSIGRRLAEEVNTNMPRAAVNAKNRQSPIIIRSHKDYAEVGLYIRIWERITRHIKE
jgi:hypothetical protein